ncbi:Inactive dual specificity phosphatase 27 [Merluccius polli]|uniref:Inactive dual specificity phosphatase 27 n=1 Tax=Merluccius polli TaxID=89951 RepID=A0AA47NRX0_MERPO|nr:Inactive dual specificity phosphatase 27 [Merluccius polli]
MLWRTMTVRTPMKRSAEHDRREGTLHHDGGGKIAPAAAAALRNGPIGAQNGPEIQRTLEGQEELILPGKDGAGDSGGGGQDGEDDDGVDSMIREWQKRNEKYQSDDWWEAQLNSDEEDTALGTDRDGDLESVALSEDVRAMKERLKKRPKRPPSDTMSTSNRGAGRRPYRKKDEDESSESTVTDAGEVRGGGEGGKKKIDDDVKSVLSDTSSMYNFCQRNKEKLTPLERWRIKRIQFGWNKKDGEDGEKSSVSGAGGGDNGEGEVRTTGLGGRQPDGLPDLEAEAADALWEENKDEIVELSRGEDSASIKRKQAGRNPGALPKNLEESQSMCGWEMESCVSGGTIPLSAFWAGPGSRDP